MVYTVKVNSNNNNSTLPPRKKSLYARAMQTFRSFFTTRNDDASTQNAVMNHEEHDSLMEASVETLDLQDLSFPSPVTISPDIFLSPEKEDMFQDLVQELAILDTMATLVDESDTIEPLEDDIVNVIDEQQEKYCELVVDWVRPCRDVDVVVCVRAGIRIPCSSK